PKSVTAQPPRIEVGEVAVRNGVISWRDEMIKPRVALDLSQLDVTVTGGGWPLRPLGVKLAVRPPGGGQLQIAGRVGVDPFDADLRVSARETELAHYQPYAPVRAQLSGRADLDLAVGLPALAEANASERRGTVRGNAAPTSGATPTRSASPSDSQGPATVPVILSELVIEEGGARVVDGSLTPPFAVDLAGLAGRIDGVSTAPGAKPARLDLKGRVGDGLLSLRGTVAALSGPLRVDLEAGLREFAVPRTNPYLVNQVAWEARDGW